LKPLLPLLDRVHIPARFRVSSLGSLDGCRLRIVLAGAEQRSLLPGGPAALLGTVLHHLVERAGRGLVPLDSAGPTAAAERELARLLELERQRLSNLGESPGLQSLLAHPPPEWRTRWKPVLRKAAARIAAAPPPAALHTSSGTSKGKMLAFEDLREGEVGYEVGVRSSALRLEGRMDFVARFPGKEVLVRDEKTGRVLDDEGALKPSLQMQLRLYGLLVLESLPGAQVRLLIDDGEEWPVSFEEAEVQQLHTSLQGFLKDLSEGKQVLAADLADTGEGCWHCPYRPACPAYRSEAPRRWIASANRPLGPDVWGHLLKVEPDTGGRVCVRVQDAAGREIRVKGVEASHGLGPETPAGTEVWLFNLEANWARATKTLSGEWVHPRNFHEVPPVGTGRRAWTLTVVGGEEAPASPGPVCALRPADDSRRAGDPSTAESGAMGWSAAGGIPRG
jgi:PD-(D/E)XK nuclease superfamily